MTLEEVVEHFGSMSNAAKAINVSRQAVTNWRRIGYIPLLQQYRFAEATEGELLPDLVDPAEKGKKRLNN